MTYDRETVRALYKKLLALYPREFRERFGESMQQTFNDLYNERKRQTEQSLFGFVLWMFINTAIGIVHEHVLLIKETNPVKSIATDSKSAAFIGFLFVLPFVVMNAIVANRIEPFFSIIRPGIHTSSLEYVLLFIVLFLIPVGAFIALRPMLRKGADGKRNYYLINGILASILLIIFVLISVGLGSDIYRCDVLQIPNCD